MISIVWPDIDVTMSPGRWAPASGMFSTSPIAPTALTFALRAASACMSPATHAAPAMSPFMSSMLAAGLIEMPPVSKHTPLPMNAIGGVPFLPPFARIPRLACARDVGDAERHARFRGSVLAFLALGLVAVERVSAQRYAERDV